MWGVGSVSGVKSRVRVWGGDCWAGSPAGSPVKWGIVCVCELCGVWGVGSPQGEFRGTCEMWSARKVDSMVLRWGCAVAVKSGMVCSAGGGVQGAPTSMPDCIDS